ncbi:MAG: group II intron reverse transcriptase/maturase [Candidatus Xenobia bacterium]
MAEAQTSKTVSTKLQQVAERAKAAPELAFMNVAHLIDVEFLEEAYRRTRKDAAPGVDRQSAQQFAEALRPNLQSLCLRMKEGTYRAPPVRRVEIPKGDGKTRPIGVPTFEDRVAQRAVAMVLDAIYEQDFLDCSYGFRPGRSTHMAIDKLWKTMTLARGGWILEVDIRGFFDHLDHGLLKSFLDRRVLDKGIRRLIHKWLRAGVQTGTELSRPVSGTPQGGVISPILANIYLHEVADVWFERMVKPVLDGQAHLIRYADDLVMLFTSEADARRVMRALPKRFGKFGLEIAAEKTKLVQFLRPQPNRPNETGTFDFLGFTHFWEFTPKKKWVVKRKTARGRLQRAVKAVTDWMKRSMHWPIMDQLKVLRSKVRGHANYYGIIGNSKAVSIFVYLVKRAWRKWLSRRSQKGRITWVKFGAFLKHNPLLPRLKPI